MIVKEIYTWFPALRKRMQLQTLRAGVNDPAKLPRDGLCSLKMSNINQNSSFETLTWQRK